MSKCFVYVTLDCGRLIITVVVLLRLFCRWIPVVIPEFWSDNRLGNPPINRWISWVIHLCFECDNKVIAPKNHVIAPNLIFWVDFKFALKLSTQKSEISKNSINILKISVPHSTRIQNLKKSNFFNPMFLFIWATQGGQTPPPPLPT